MAVVQTPFAMTIGQSKMYNVIQQHSPPQPLKTGSVIHLQGGKRPLAPAPERSERTSVLVANNNNSGDLRCKRKIQFVAYGGPQPQPASVARRNARERNRVKQVNNGFATLRQHIPQSVAQALAPQAAPATGRGASKKLSKVETLRLAVEYIRSLKQMIDETDPGSGMGEQDSRFFGEQQYQYPILLPTPTCSEASASPTPSSHSSEGSFSAASSYTNNTIYHQENYENYEPKSPEDEELLDAIFSWQQE